MKDISIHFIRYFTTLVDCRKFNKAAEKLHLSQPALSKSVILLEQQIGTPLLNRYHHSFELTEAGKLFYESAIYFLQIYDDFLYDINSRIASPYSGTVRFSASGVLLDLFFLGIVERISQEHPSIKIFTREEDTISAIQSLLSHKADIGTALYPLPDAYKNSFVSHHLLSSAFHIVLPGDHFLAANDNISITDLNGVSVFTPGELSYVHQKFNLICMEHHVRPNITCSCSQIQFLCGMVSASTGVAVLPAAFLTGLPPQLTHRPLVPKIPWNLALIYLRDSYVSLSTGAVIDIIVDYFQTVQQKITPPDEYDNASSDEEDQ